MDVTLIELSSFISQLVKNRFDGDQGVMLLKFDKESLSFAPKPKTDADKKTSSKKKPPEDPPTEKPEQPTEESTDSPTDLNYGL